MPQMYFTYYPHLPEKLTIIYTVYKISLSTERSNMAVTENTTSKYAQTAQENVAAPCLVAQSRPTLCDPMDSGPLGSSIHQDSPGNTGVGCHALLHGIFPIQGWNPDLPHCRRILHSLSHPGSPKKTLGFRKYGLCSIGFPGPGAQSEGHRGREPKSAILAGDRTQRLSRA